MVYDTKTDKVWQLSGVLVSTLASSAGLLLEPTCNINVANPWTNSDNTVQNTFSLTFEMLSIWPTVWTITKYTIWSG